MEYLLLPTNPTMPPIEVPFPDKELYWHHGEWDEYIAGKYWDNFPRRFGYHSDTWWDESSQHSNKAWSNPEFHGWLFHMPANKLHSVIVAWLYFGTLSEVTCCELDVNQYLKRGQHGQNVLSLTSTQFELLFGLWLAVQLRFKGSKYVRGSPRHGQVQTEPVSLANNRDNLRTLMFTQDNASTRIRLDAYGKSTSFEQAHRCLQQSKAILGLARGRLDAATVFVIANLHETLAHMLLRVYQGDVTTAYDPMNSRWSLGRWTLGMDFCHFTRDRWKGLGWCPRTIRALVADSTRTLAYDYALSNIKSPQSDEDHTACTEEVCLVHQIDEKDYARAHACEGCSCPDLGVDTDVAEALLADPASFPLVRLDTEDDSVTPALELSDATEETDFIAVSHVWSHGLGNPQGNSMRSCQVKRIQHLVDKVASSGSTVSQNFTPFWIDTLCCPVQSASARKAAIQRMTLTYQKATQVLVLDRELQKLTASTLSDLDLLLHIFSSTWTTRLWTLQEAKFARKLWFQFKDKAINLDDLHTRFENSNETSATRLIARDLIVEKTSSSRFGLRTELASLATVTGGDPCMDAIISIPFSLLGRSTSRAGDEAVCICTLLRYNVVPILQFPASDTENRMIALWKQVPKVPPGILFNPGRRLKSHGFRWAPETFIRSRGTHIEQFPSNEHAVIDPLYRGLNVTMPGWKLTTAGGFRAAREHTIGRLPMKTFLIREANNSMKWYDVDVEHATHGPLSYVEPDADIAILMNPHTGVMNIDPRGRQGLLVRITREQEGTIFAQSLCVVQVSESEIGAAKIFACSEVISTWQASGLGSVPGGPDFISNMMYGVLEQPEIKAYMQMTLARNASKLQTWFRATDRQRTNWDFRCRHGDGKLLIDDIVYWRNVTSTVQPLPSKQKWCID